MAGITPATLSGYLESFATYVDASNYSSAKAELVKAEAILQSLPSTDQATWRGTLDRCWEMLVDLETSDRATQGTLGHAAFRNKQRSTQS